MLRSPHTERGRQSGLTLIEVLISMIVLSIITTMLVVAWISLQRGAAFAVTTNNARATARDAISRVSTELRAAQPTSVPSPQASVTALPTGLPPLKTAGQWSVQFYSAYNNPTALSDGTSVGKLRLTEIALNPLGSTDPKEMQTLYLRRDLTNNNSVGDAGDLKVVLARNVVNKVLYDQNSSAQQYSLFVYGYRTSSANPVTWFDNRDSTLDLSTIVAVRARVIVDANIAHTPKYIDTTTTVRLRNASGS